MPVPVVAPIDGTSGTSVVTVTLAFRGSGSPDESTIRPLTRA
jgi:hypothetical protein